MTRKTLLWVLLAMIVLSFAQQWWRQAQDVEIVPYSEFEDLLAEGRLSEITVGDTMVTGKLQAPLRGKTTVAANRVEPDVAEPLAKAAYSQAPVMP